MKRAARRSKPIADPFCPRVHLVFFVFFLEWNGNHILSVSVSAGHLVSNDYFPPIGGVEADWKAARTSGRVLLVNRKKKKKVLHRFLLLKQNDEPQEANVSFPNQQDSTTDAP